MTSLTKYTKNGHEFALVSRDGNVAIFHGLRIGGESSTWEVIHINPEAAYERFGNQYPAQELPPPNSEWGYKGWTYVSLADAAVKYKSEVDVQNTKAEA